MLHLLSSDFSYLLTSKKYNNHSVHIYKTENNDTVKAGNRFLAISQVDSIYFPFTPEVGLRQNVETKTPLVRHGWKG